MLPDKPGRYPLRLPDGRTRLVKVKSHNNELIAVMGRWMPMAVPVASVQGRWLERMR